jgi:alkylhydroperoxidase family enzyme
MSEWSAGAAGGPEGPTVRVTPLPRRALGLRAGVAAAVTARATGGEAPRVFTTLARHPRLFRSWLRFSGVMLLRGDLPAVDRELVILRTAWRSRSWYEWAQHVTLAGRAGLTQAAVERVAAGPSDAGWTPRERALLTATDELHDRHVITDPTWAALAAELTQRQLIELCLLVGQYEMLAMALNSLGVRPEPSTLARLQGGTARRAAQLRDALSSRRR